MLAYSVIEKKQQGLPLSFDELAFFVNGFVKGELPDYQMSALLMAIYFRGMNEEEVKHLIQLIIESGDHKRFRDQGYYYADKHSTGGVGDKISIILAPLLAATDTLRIPMISGRGLGHSGGTLDKLESIPGFNTALSMDDFEKQTKEIGCALIGQTENICPADKKLYALRDVTATVRSIPLICASILSKKTAEGIQGLILDVKTGIGAFMQDPQSSRELAENLVLFGKAFGLNVQAQISDMNQPLGHTVGNWLEIQESLDVLQGKGPDDVRELSLVLSTHLMKMAFPDSSDESIRKELVQLLDSGQAFEKFCEISRAQGGDTDYLTGKKSMGEAAFNHVIRADRNGYLKSIDAYMLGLQAIELGAGRKQHSDKISPRAGMTVAAKVGDKISRGDTLATLYSENRDALVKVADRLSSAFSLTDEKVDALPLLHDHIK